MARHDARGGARSPARHAALPRPDRLCSDRRSSPAMSWTEAGAPRERGTVRSAVVASISVVNRRQEERSVVGVGRRRPQLARQPTTLLALWLDQDRSVVLLRWWKPSPV